MGSLLRAAYCYYLFANKTSLTDLLNDALILAKRLGLGLGLGSGLK